MLTSHSTRKLRSPFPTNTAWALALSMSLPVSTYAASLNVNWSGTASGVWSTASNWSGGATPQNAGPVTYDVSASGATISVNGYYDIDALQLASGTVSIAHGNRLTLSANSSNDGLINLADGHSYTGASYDAYLRINGNVNLSGSGNVKFSSGFNNSIIETTSTDQLTIGANQTMGTNGTGTRGAIYVATNNQGTIEANGGNLTLTSRNATNTGLIQSTNNGSLTVSSITIDNTGGTLISETGSDIHLTNTTINAGNINGGGNVYINAASTFDNTTLDGVAINVNHGDNLILRNTITNNTAVLVNDGHSYTGAAYDSYVSLGGNVNLQGSGQLEFVSPRTGYLLEGTVGNTLTLGAAQTIRARSGGSGNLQADIVNNGVIEADGGTLSLSLRSKTNNNVIQAINSGNLSVSGITIENTLANLRVDNTSSINLSSATINNGTLSGVTGAGAGTVNIGGTVNLNNLSLAGVTTNINHGDNLVLNNSITNDGTLRLADGHNYTGASYDAYLRTNGNVTLNGSGEIQFASSLSNFILETASSDTLTVGNAQTITTTSGGVGNIYVATTNEGLIEANAGTITLASRNKNNNAVIQAINGGVLNVNSIAINNNTAEIKLDSTSTVNLNSASLTGGDIVGVAGAGGNLNIGGTTNLTDVHLGNVTTNINHGDNLVLNNTITNDGVLRLADGHNYTGPSYDAYLRTNGNVTLDGSGEIQFASSRANFILETTSSDILTVGSAQTIKTTTGGNGSIYVATTNKGLIEANAGTITLASRNKNNDAIIRAKTGGTININSITVDNSGGDIQIETGSTLNLNSATLQGGTLSGGGTANTGGTALLNGVTTDLTINSNHGDNLRISNTVTNNGNIVLADGHNYTGSSYDAYLRTEGNATLAGNGQITFASNRNNFILESAATDTLTIGSNQTITTTAGSRGYVYVNTVNQGRIDANGGTLYLSSRNKTNDGVMAASNNGLLSVSVDVDGNGGWDANAGRVLLNAGVDATTTGFTQIRNGGEIELNGNRLGTGDFTIDNSGILDVNSGLVSVAGDFSFALTNEANWQWSTNTNLELTGGFAATTSNWNQWASLEIGGIDLGTDPANHVGDPAGFNNGNFYLPELIIGAGAHIFLADNINNGNRGGLFGHSEALFVDRLVLSDSNSILNLNGLNIYYNTLVGDSGQIIDQTVVLTAFNSANVPVPAAWGLMLSGLLILLNSRRKRRFF